MQKEHIFSQACRKPGPLLLLDLCVQHSLVVAHNQSFAFVVKLRISSKSFQSGTLRRHFRNRHSYP